MTEEEIVVEESKAPEKSGDDGKGEEEEVTDLTNR
jgi:hypothetical protein